MSPANLVTEIHQKLCKNRALSTGEPCTCEYVTLLQSAHRGTLSIYWYIAQNFQPAFSMSVLFRRLSRTVIFSRFSKVAIATSNFINEFWSKGAYSQVQGSQVVKALSLQSFQRISTTRFAELIQFQKDPKCWRNRTFSRKNLVFHQRKLSYFVFRYIFPLVLHFISSFNIYVHIYIRLFQLFFIIGKRL